MLGENMYRANIPLRNETLFFKSLVVIEQKKHRFLNVVPPFRDGLNGYEYEVYGTDDTRLENIIICKKNILSKQIITFGCQLGHTYFIKIIGKYAGNVEEFFHFYKMEDDIEESDNNFESTFDKNDRPKTTFIIPMKKQEDNISENTEPENITDVEVDNHQEKEENKITQYLMTRTPNSGLDIESEELDFRNI